MIKKSYILIVVMILFYGCRQPQNDTPVITEETNEKKELYTLQIPDDVLSLKTESIDSIEFEIVHSNQETFLQEVRPLHWRLDYRWIADIPPAELSTDEHKKPAPGKWKLMFSNDKKDIQILGFKYSKEEGYILKYELKGEQNEKEFWEGEGLVSCGFGEEMNKDFDRIFKIKWRLFLSSLHPEEDEQLKQIELTKEIPKQYLNPHAHKTDEEMQSEFEFSETLDQSAPPLDMFSLRLVKSDYLANPLRAYGNDASGKKAKRYIRDYIVPDLEWSELDALPESIVLIDHLAEIEDKRVRETLSQVYAKQDNSWPPLMDQDLKAWTKVPLIFLLVHYSDWLTPERMENLSKTTPRMKFLMKEIEKHGKDSPNHLDEIMISVLKQMSEKDRFDYFTKCLRLREYVKNSSNESLQSLMPSELPDPPELQPNLRTWTEGEKTVRGAFFGLDKEKVTLSLLDPEGSEFALYYPDVSEEDKAYVEEQLKKKKQNPKPKL